MNRRQFLLANGAAVLASSRQLTAVPLRVEIDLNLRLGKIAPDFIGLGYEISSIAEGVLSAKNRSYVNFVKQVGSEGVIRIGGNTSDYARFDPNATALSSPKATVVNGTNLHDLAAFLDVTGWRLIWGLNLGRGNRQRAGEEAEAVARSVGNKLLAFEIGNEPDLFSHAHRDTTYGYDDYLREYRNFKAAIRHAVPHAPFAGPDAATRTDWVTRFAADEGADLKLLTHHYYRECASPTASLDRLLHPDPKLELQLQQLNSASSAAHVPYRICEVNSLCGGGKAGVSDTLGSALWLLDYMFTVAEAGGSGVNIETGVNQLGWVSWYSPIVRDREDAWTVRPDYYGMLAFAQASRGYIIPVHCETQGLNLRAHAVGDEHNLSITIINKDSTRDADVTVLPARPSHLRRLTGPAIDSRTGVTFHAAEMIFPRNDQLLVHVPAASAAVLTSSTQ